LNGYLRATLSASRSSQAKHTLEQEFERLHDYLELMHIRMGPRLQFTLDLPAPLRGVHVPPLLLQPLVENSIRHGLEPRVEGGSITITARQTGDQVCIEVADTGLGFDSTAPQGTGFGVAHVRERLATLYPGVGSLRLSRMEPGGTCAVVTLPLQP
jgi:LytS/YehU family sensor histidine kinase